jgi:SAM-dependent methyltransferase
VSDPRRERSLSFGSEAAAYERGRPSYPPEAVDWLLAPTDTFKAREVLDLGAGTGKLTTRLVERGLSVTAVDHIAEMLDMLRGALPDTPAINEIVPGYIALNWYAIAAPRATPPAIIARMAETLGSIRDLPDVRARFAAAGTTPLLTGPAELAALLESDVPQWQRVVAATGIKVE